MRYLIRTFQMDLKRCILQKRFWFCVVLVFATILLTSGYLFEFGEVDVLMLCCLGMAESSCFLVITGVLPAFAYAGSYSSDHRQKAVRYYSSRSGIWQYAISKYVIALLAGMLVFGLGIVLTALVFSAMVPFYAERYGAGDGYFILVENGHPVGYFVLFVLHYMLSAACFAGTAFFVSVLVPEPFTAYTLPMIVFFLLKRFGEGGISALWLRPGALMEGIYNLGSPAATFGKRAGILLLYCVILGVSSAAGIVRRVRRS